MILRLAAVAIVLVIVLAVVAFLYFRSRRGSGVHMWEIGGRSDRCWNCGVVRERRYIGGGRTVEDFFETIEDAAARKRGPTASLRDVCRPTVKEAKRHVNRLARSEWDEKFAALLKSVGPEPKPPLFLGFIREPETLNRPIAPQGYSTITGPTYVPSASSYGSYDALSGAQDFDPYYGITSRMMEPEKPKPTRKPRAKKAIEAEK